MVQSAVLVCADTGEFDSGQSLAELAELARTAGAEVIAEIVQNRDSIDNATYIGKGKLEETAEFCRQNDVDLLIFDHELSGTQIKNIENVTDVKVVDRTMLILDIFAGRAHSKEGKLQVELAQQRYYLPRLSGLGTSLSRLGGGIGTRGPGETKLESDRRHIRRRIDALSKELEELDKRRRLRRERRKKDMVTTVAIVGYTNAGKSTLLNTLTGAGVLAENKLFATLDTTSRSLLLPDGREVMLIDTVGLIRRLPHHLIQAFKSTLGEMSSADLILHICDASSVDCLSQMEVCDKLLEELGCGSIPLINVFNKCDIARDGIITGSQGAAISAKTGQGIDELLQKIAGKLSGTVQIEINIPYSKGSLGALIRANGKVLSEEFTPSGVLTKAIVDVMIIKELGECEIA